VLLSAMFGVRPKLVVLHFIDNDLRREGIRGLLDVGWRPVERWALRRSMVRAQAGVV
jgi:hypothetical protein